MLGGFLKTLGAESILIEKVESLISKHEVGGDEDQNLLKDADSISFFENQVDHFLKKHVKEFGKEKVKEKFDWMYNRISSEKARSIARPLYEKAIRMLENISLV